MTSTMPTSTELCQTVIYDKINLTIGNSLQYIDNKNYELALVAYQQILQQINSLKDTQQQETLINYLFATERIANLPVNQLSHEQQNQWLEWLQKIQQYVLNFSPNTSANILQQLARIYDNFHRRDLVAIALSQATLAASKITDPLHRLTCLIPIATLWLKFRRLATAVQITTQALAAYDQIEQDDIYVRWTYIQQIASLYIQAGLPQSALALIPKLDSFGGFIRQEVVRDAINRKQIHFAQVVAAQIQQTQSQTQALVEIAVYLATHNHRNRANRLFTQALELASQNEGSESLQSLLIQIYTQSGQLKVALNAAQKLTQDEPKALALGAIVVAYAQGKQHRQVQKLLSQLSGLIQSAAAVNPVGYLGNILRFALNAGQYDLAMTILNGVKNQADFSTQESWYREILFAQLLSQRLNKAVQLAKQIPRDVWADERSARLQEIAIAYAKVQKWHRAVELLPEIQNTRVLPYQVLTRIELAVIATTETAFSDLIEPAIAQAQTLELKEHKALALVAIAQAYLRAGHPQLTQSFLQQAIETVKQDGYIEEQGNLIVAMSDYLIRQRQYTAALTVAQANPVSYWQQLSYSNIFQQALQARAFDVALQIIELDSLPDTQAAQLIEIATTYAQLQRHEDALALLDRAFELAQQIADPESRMIQISEGLQLPDERDRAHQYTRLVQLYVNLGALNQAQKVIQSVQSTQLRDYLQGWIDC